MHYRSLDEFTQIATVQPAPTPSRYAVRRQRLHRLADLPYLCTTDDLAERVRRIGGTPLRSIGHVAKLRRIKDNVRLRAATRHAARTDTRHQGSRQHMREAHGIAEKLADVATASLLETMIDDAEKRVWFLFEASRVADRTDH